MNIIIVEDDPDTLEIFSRAFTRRGHDVTVFDHGQTALDHFNTMGETLPDAVLLDVNLPGVSGIYLLRILRQKLGLTDLPVVMVTANSVAVDAAEMKLASTVLSKPISLKQLTETVQSLVNVDTPMN